jgi:hypothetical protein
MLTIQTLRRLRQEDCEFEASLGNMRDTVSKKRKKENSVRCLIDKSKNIRI